MGAAVKAGQFAADVALGPAKDLLKAAGSAGTAVQAAASVADKLGTVNTAALTSATNNIIGSAKVPSVGAIGDSIQSGIKSAAGIVEDVGDGIGDLASNVGGKIGQVVDSVGNRTADVVNSIKKGGDGPTDISDILDQS